MLHIVAPSSRFFSEEKRASKCQIKTEQSLADKCFLTFLINHWKVTLPKVKGFKGMEIRRTRKSE